MKRSRTIRNTLENLTSLLDAAEDKSEESMKFASTGNLNAYLPVMEKRNFRISHPPIDYHSIQPHIAFMNRTEHIGLFLEESDDEETHRCKMLRGPNEQDILPFLAYSPPLSAFLTSPGLSTSPIISGTHQSLQDNIDSMDVLQSLNYSIDDQESHQKSFEDTTEDSAKTQKYTSSAISLDLKSGLDNGICAPKKKKSIGGVDDITKHFIQLFTQNGSSALVIL